MPIKTTDWIQTYTGKKFYPLEPDIEIINIVDIARSLSNLCRFNGHSLRHYSVAEHSLSCLGLARHMGLSYSDRYAALMHDASEAYLADIPRPVKRFLPEYAGFEKVLEEMIAKKYGIIYPYPAVVHKIDNIMLATERRDLFTNPDPWGSLTEEPSEFINVTQPMHIGGGKMMQFFLNEFMNLRKALRLPVDHEDL